MYISSSFLTDIGNWFKRIFSRLFDDLNHMLEQYDMEVSDVEREVSTDGKDTLHFMLKVNDDLDRLEVRMTPIDDDSVELSMWVEGKPGDLLIDKAKMQQEDVVDAIISEVKQSFQISLSKEGFESYKQPVTQSDSIRFQLTKITSSNYIDIQLTGVTSSRSCRDTYCAIKEIVDDESFEDSIPEGVSDYIVSEDEYNYNIDRCEASELPDPYDEVVACLKMYYNSLSDEDKIHASAIINRR